MRNIAIILLAALALGSCKEQDFGYPGELVIVQKDPDFAVISSAATLRIPIESDRSNIYVIVPEEDQTWLNAYVEGKEVIVEVKENPEDNPRIASIRLYGDTRMVDIGIYQEGQVEKYMQLIPAPNWKATASDEQENDGGGVGGILSTDNSKYWHSSWNPQVNAPHTVTVDMGLPKTLAGLHLYWRSANHRQNTQTEIYSSLDGREYTYVGLMDISGGSGDSDRYIFPAPVQTRFVKMIIVKDTGVSNMRYFGALITAK